MINLQRLEGTKKNLIFAIFLAAVFFVELVRTAGNIVFKSSVEVVLPVATRIELIDFSIANNGSYRVEFLFNGDVQPIIETSPVFSRAGMVRHIGRLDVPTP